MAKINRGDVIAGTLGYRRALKGFVGVVPESIHVGDTIHVLNLGGVLGLCVGRNPDVGSPLEVEVLGAVLLDGKPANISRNALPPRDELPAGPPLIVVAGTCMSAGKTAAASEIVKRFANAGLKVAAAKLSGVACLKDTLDMEDHGAFATLSFLDCGLPSTAHVKDLAPYARAILAELGEKKPDVIVVELGDGILGDYRVGTFFTDPDLVRATKAVVMCANDLVAAWGAQQLMEQWKIPITVISGPVTDNQTGTEYISQADEAPGRQRDDRRARALRHRLRGDTEMTIKAAIFGASGYAGGELLRLLLDHPKAEPVAVISRSQAGQAVANVHAHLSRLTDLTFVSELPRGADEPEVIFLAGANGYASEVAPALLDTGIPVVDLSADFRLKDPVAFEKFYGPPTAAFARRNEFVYGLPELFREQIASSRAVASPGCFATATILALAPLWKKGLVADAAPVSVFAITGSSGAGVHPVTDDPSPAPGVRVLRLRHRRPPAPAGDRGVALGRGAARRRADRLPDPLRAARARHLRDRDGAVEARDGPRRLEGDLRRGVRVGVLHPHGRGLPGRGRGQGHELRRHRRRRAGTAEVFIAIDNLVKGAAGQAIQAMNIMFGIPEPTGLKMTESFHERGCLSRGASHLHALAAHARPRGGIDRLGRRGQELPRSLRRARRRRDGALPSRGRPRDPRAGGRAPLLFERRRAAGARARGGGDRGGGAGAALEGLLRQLRHRG